MSTLKRYCRILSISSHEVDEIIDVLARARVHLSKNQRAITAQLIHQAEDKLKVLGREKEKENDRTG